MGRAWDGGQGLILGFVLGCGGAGESPGRARRMLQDPEPGWESWGWETREWLQETGINMRFGGGTRMSLPCSHPTHVVPQMTWKKKIE